MSDLGGRTYVVGGASKGLGRAIAEELVDRGAQVLLVSRTEDALQEVKAQLGDAAHVCAADLAAPDGPQRIADAAHAAFGDTLDGIVVNGGGPAIGFALQLEDETWQAAYDILIAGPIRLLKLLTPRMTEKGGSVVFVTSTTVRQPIAGLDTSNVLRPAVAALVKTLSHQLGPAIRLNSIGPGRFDTDRVRSLDEMRSSYTDETVDEIRAAAGESIPLKRYGDPKEFAKATVFLLSDDASYITGQAIMADGGSTTALP